MLAGDAERVEDAVATPAVALLPSLDSTTMGWRGRDWYVGTHAHRLFDRTGNAGATIWLDGRVVGGFVAWTPPHREVDDTDRSVLHILAGQTAAALQNCALLDRSERLLAQTLRQARDLERRHDELQATQAELGAARQREVLDSERHRIARELHDSVTQYALSAGMQIEVVRSSIADPVQRERLGTAKELTRRAVEQLRSAIYALGRSGERGRQSLPAMLEELSTVHMPSDLRVEVRLEGRPVALSSTAERSLFRVAGEALFNTAVHAEASRAVVRLAYRGDQVRLTISDDGCGRPEEVRRSLRAASVACPSGEHRGLVNMAARARELGGTLTFRRARLGGLQVQVDIPIPEPAGAQTVEAGRR
jgi:signal transduction histidine kinase